MAVNYRSSLKTTRMTSVADDIDSGAGSNGTLEVLNAAQDTVLATINLNTAPAATVSGAVLTLAGLPKTQSTPNANGTAAFARIKNKAGTVIVSGLTVGTSGTDLIANTTTVNTGIPFTLQTGTITHSA